MKNNRITILYLIDTYLPRPDQPAVGGTEKQLSLLVSSLNSNVFRPIVVQLGPHSIENTADTIGNVKLFHFPTRKIYSLHGLNQIRKLSKLAKDEKVNIIHTFFEKSEVMGWLVKRLAGIPIWVTSRRDLGFKRKEIYNKIFKISSRDCDRCVANCDAVKEQTLQKERLPEEKVEVIYNGMDFSPYKKSYNGNAFRKEIGIDNQTSLVGMIANFNFEIKGHRFFIEAAKKVLEQIPAMEFVLVGDGTLTNRFRNMAKDLGLRNHIHFLGKRSNVPSILSSLNVSVLCSTSEGFSNVILESMATGKPVIATNVGGSPEMVIDGITGYVIPPGDSESLANAIISLVQNPGKAIAMGEAGRKVVENKFTVEKMVKSYERLYSSLISEICTK